VCSDDEWSTRTVHCCDARQGSTLCIDEGWLSNTGGLGSCDEMPTVVGGKSIVGGTAEHGSWLRRLGTLVNSSTVILTS
jgi:hypothetical protein